MERLICLAIGYVFGNFQTAFFYGKLHGIDIREHGSGNAGTTNTLRVLGRKAGAIVFIGDVLKCALALWTTKLLYGSSQADIIYILTLYAAFGTILGHNYPAWLGFRGGKGMACTAGFMFFYHPWMLLACVFIFATVFLITHYVSLGSLLVYAGFVAVMAALCFTGSLGALSLAQITELMLLSLVMAAMAYIRHWTNIKRLIKGTESKTYLSKKNRQKAG